MCLHYVEHIFIHYCYCCCCCYCLMHLSLRWVAIYKYTIWRKMTLMTDTWKVWLLLQQMNDKAVQIYDVAGFSHFINILFIIYYLLFILYFILWELIAIFFIIIIIIISVRILTISTWLFYRKTDLLLASLCLLCIHQ